MNFRIYANGVDVSQYVWRNSLRIVEQLNNRANVCDFSTLNYKIDQSEMVYIYEGYETSAAVTASATIPVVENYKRFDQFAAGDEIIVDPEGAWREYVTILSISDTNKTITLTSNVTLAKWTFIWRLIFAGTVERNPDTQIWYSENFEYKLTVVDWTTMLNRKNVVDVFEEMYWREIIGRMIYWFTATDSSIVLNNFDSAWTESGVARAMTNETTDLIEGTASQSTGATGAGTATRTKTITSQDISDATDIRLRSKIWAAIWNKITSMKVRVGNDSSNYLERSSVYVNTTDEECRNYENFKIDRATETGTVNLATIDWLQIEVVASASIAAGWILFDEITATSWGFYLLNVIRGTRKFDRINWNYDKASNLIENIAKKQSLFRKVDYNRNISVFEANDTPAPFDIDDTSQNYGDLSIKADTSMLRNRQVVRGGEAPSTTLYPQIFVADGSQTSFTLDYKPKDLAVYVDTGGGYVAKTLWIENLVDESSVQFVYNFQEKVVRNGSHATLSAGHKIKFVYYPYQAVRVRVSDPTSIATMKALAGGDWIFDGPVINDNSITSFAEARKRARAEIDAYSNPVISASFVTEQGGLHAWQTINIVDASRSLSSDFIIQKVVRESVSGAKSVYKVECASTMFGLIEFFQLLLKKTDRLESDASEIVDIVVNEDETITITFAAVFTQSPDEFLAGSVRKKIYDFTADSWTNTASWVIGAQKQWKAVFSANTNWSCWFEASNYNTWQSMFLEVTSYTWSSAWQYIQVDQNNLLAAKWSTDYNVYAWIENLVADGLTGWVGFSLVVQELSSSGAVLATNTIVSARNTKQDFKRTNVLAFTTNASTTYFNIVAKISESVGKISVSRIVIEENEVESVVNAGIASFSSAS